MNYFSKKTKKKTTKTIETTNPSTNEVKRETTLTESTTHERRINVISDSLTELLITAYEKLHQIVVATIFPALGLMLSEIGSFFGF